MWTQDAHKAAFGERAGQAASLQQTKARTAPLQRQHSGRGCNAVVEVDDAVGEGFGGEEFEADGAMARLDQGDALADEDGGTKAGTIKMLCRTSGAPDCRFYLYPALAGWANV